MQKELRRIEYPTIATFRGELWTARQRQMHPVHYSVSYRASFKPELPDYFIRHYLAGKQSATVLDPFGGRGTTNMAANLLGYSGIHNDLNPVASFIAKARSTIPGIDELILVTKQIAQRPQNIKPTAREKRDLLPFFHEDTLKEILTLRKTLLENPDNPAIRYIGLTALSRLHGHSDGFFSVYSFPQISILPSAQAKNNIRRNQKPEYRNIYDRIIRKMKRDLAMPLPEGFAKTALQNRYITEDARFLSSLKDSSVDLIVTSPPFLDKVDYLTDNWMRSWFLQLEETTDSLDLTVTPNLNDWAKFMGECMAAMGRVLRPNGVAVIEVGEVITKDRLIPLEQSLIENIPQEVKGGKLRPEAVFLNEQNFTKLSNCWDVANNLKGTNTNRCLVLRKMPLLKIAGRRPKSPSSLEIRSK